MSTAAGPPAPDCIKIWNLSSRLIAIEAKAGWSLPQLPIACTMQQHQVTVIETLRKIVDVPVVKQVEVPQVLSLIESGMQCSDSVKTTQSNADDAQIT